MKRNPGYIILIVFFLLFIGACEQVIDTPEPSAGPLDLSHYISVGNSVTAGYANGGLYASAQLRSYPNLLSRQFRKLAGGEFRQPLADGAGSGYQYLDAFIDPDCIYAQTLPDIKREEAEANWQNSVYESGPFNNLGVPGLTVSSIPSPLFGAFNPFFGRMVSSPTETSYLMLAGQSKPTFFTIWLGNNDVLFHAYNGGDPGYPITDVQTFRENYYQLLDSMTKDGAAGAVADLPDVTSIPLFNTVPIEMIDPQACDGSSLPVYIETANGTIRPAEEGDYILLSELDRIGLKDTAGIYPYGLHPEYPVPKQEVLDKAETANVKTAIQNYNDIIRQAAVEYGLALVELNDFFESANGGFTSDGLEISGAYIYGGAFSLDGIHPTPRGQALLANEFIKSINTHYGASIPTLNAGDYEGVIFP